MNNEEVSMPIIQAEDYTPKEIVDILDRYIIGQHKAKRAVAIALRNRWRRQRVREELQNEIYPKNIIMIGPTGVGKTEIARRLAKLAKAPFVKVEASKFTEVGYVGRDVESMIRDLTEIAFQMVRKEEQKRVRDRAQVQAENLIIDKLFPISQVASQRPAYELEDVSTSKTTVFAVDPSGNVAPSAPSTSSEQLSSSEELREQRRIQLRNGEFNERMVDIEVHESSMPMMQVFSNAGLEEMGLNMQELFENSPFGNRTKNRQMKVEKALQILLDQEAGRLVDKETVTREAIRLVENSGIVFIDEIDKIASRQSGSSQGPDVSREGVQRDILPVVEGSTVTTKYGLVHTDHILFIAAGAFHMAQVSDLIPELQGRFPIRVELDSLTEEDFLRILTEPDNSLVKQYLALMETEGVSLEFSDTSLKEISRLAAVVNQRSENIGARRLHTVMERLLDSLSFEAPDKRGETVSVDETYVKHNLSDIVEDQDLSRYIL